MTTYVLTFEAEGFEDVQQEIETDDQKCKVLTKPPFCQYIEDATSPQKTDFLLNTPNY